MSDQELTTGDVVLIGTGATFVLSGHPEPVHEALIGRYGVVKNIDPTDGDVCVTALPGAEELWTYVSPQHLTKSAHPTGKNAPTTMAKEANTTSPISEDTAQLMLAELTRHR